MKHAPSILLPLDALRSLYADVALALGASVEEADIYSGCFSRADLRHDTQGLPLWLEWALPLAEAGGGRFGTPLRIVTETASSIMVDGSGGVGQVIASRTMERVVDLAKASGVAIGLVANTTDMAMVGNYALQASDRGCIGLAACTAGPASVAPWGGTQAVFGTDPLAVAFPAGKASPILIDMCCASFSIGTLVDAARAGRISDTPVVADREGRYSTDPASIISDLGVREPELTGAILPEGVRSAALLLMVEILAGLLTGTGASRDQAGWTTARPPRVGAFLCAIDVARFGAPEAFHDRLQGLADAIRAVPPGPGFDAVRLPGDRADALEAERRMKGVGVSERHWTMIQDVCRRYGLQAPEVPALS